MSGRYTRVAGPAHTIGVLAALGCWSFWGNILANRLSEAAYPDRLRFYASSMLFEWLLFCFVLVGVRRSGVSVHAVLGDHWHSLRQVFRDIGIAAVFWIVTLLLLWILGWLLRIAAHSRDLHFMLPHRGMELATWIALSITAGICEETIFRGYVQRQFLALTQNRDDHPKLTISTIVHVVMFSNNIAIHKLILKGNGAPSGFSANFPILRAVSTGRCNTI